MKKWSMNVISVTIELHGRVISQLTFNLYMKDWSIIVTSVTIKLLSRVVLHIRYSQYMKSKNRVPNQNFLGILCHKTTWIHLARLSYVIYDNKYRYICLYLMCRRVLRRTRASNLRSHLLHFSRMDGGMEEKNRSIDWLSTWVNM